MSRTPPPLPSTGKSLKREATNVFLAPSGSSTLSCCGNWEKGERAGHWATSGTTRSRNGWTQFHCVHEVLEMQVQRIDQYHTEASSWAEQIAERMNKVEFGINGAASELGGVWQAMGARHDAMLRRVDALEGFIDEA